MFSNIHNPFLHPFISCSLDIHQNDNSIINSYLNTKNSSKYSFKPPSIHPHSGFSIFLKISMYQNLLPAYLHPNRGISSSNFAWSLHFYEFLWISAANNYSKQPIWQRLKPTICRLAADSTVFSCLTVIQRRQTAGLALP